MEFMLIHFMSLPTVFHCNFHFPNLISLRTSLASSLSSTIYNNYSSYTLCFIMDDCHIPQKRTRGADARTSEAIAIARSPSHKIGAKRRPVLRARAAIC